MFKTILKMTVVAGGAAYLVDRYGSTVGLDKITSNPLANQAIHYMTIGALTGVTGKLAKFI